MDINYERLEWEDFPSTETPINADNLNHLEEGIAGLYAERYEMQSNIAYVEDGETASKDYIPNSYLMRDGLFYKVTKTILYGDSFDSGEDGNIEHVDISSQFGSGGGGSTGCVELTQAQYDALSDEAKMLDVIYLITDSPDNYLDEVFGDFATVEYTDTASKAYAVGDYLVYDSKFYKVTSGIAQGDTIVPDTNVVKTTVADELGTKADNNDSGSGYCKMPDGTLIQWGYLTVESSGQMSQVGTSGIYASPTITIRFPLAFKDSWYVLTGISKYSTGHNVPIGAWSSGIDSFSAIIYDFYKRPLNDGLYVIRWQAIGNWK